MATTRAVEPGDWVAVPEYIEDTELLKLEFSADSIRRLRRGEFVAGLLLTRGVGSKRRGQGRARRMNPGGDPTPTWKIDNLEGSILLVPEHMLEVSSGPPAPSPYTPPDLGVDFDLHYLIEEIIAEDHDVHDVTLMWGGRITFPPKG